MSRTPCRSSKLDNKTKIAKLPGMTKKPAKSCFISYRNENDIAAVRRILEDAGIKVSTAASEGVGHSIWESIHEAIKNADFVVAVLSDDIGSPALFYEIGFALALEKRVLTIAARRDYQIPGIGTGNIIFPGTPNDIEGLRFAIEQISGAPPLTKRRITTGAKREHKSALGLKARTFLEEYESIKRHDRNFLELEELVASVLRQLRLTVVRNDATRAKADFVVWLDSSTSAETPPLFIEVKNRIGNFHFEFNEFHERALRQNPETPPLLVLYSSLSSELNREVRLRNPHVLFCEIGKFISSLASMTLPEFLREERNRNAHGLYST